MNNQGFSEPRAGDHLSNRRNLLIGFIPLLVPLALCLFTVTQRLMLEAKYPLRMSSGQASHKAADVCQEMIGGDVRAGQATLYQAFSAHTQQPMRQWDVVCDTSQGQYLFRINADTQQVFGINRLADDQAPSERESRLSRAEAEVYSRRYLTLLGISPDELRLVAPKGTDEPACWSFQYRTPMPGRESRLLTITVEAATGSLVYAWNSASLL